MSRGSNDRRLAGSIRIDTTGRGGMIDQHGSTIIRQTVTIVDVTRWGCRIEGARDLCMGDSISIRIPTRGAVPAAVMGYDGEAYECTFDVFLSPLEVETACAEPEAEDVTAIRRRVRDTMLRSLDEAPPPKQGVLARLLRRKTG